MFIRIDLGINIFMKITKLINDDMCRKHGSRSVIISRRAEMIVDGTMHRWHAIAEHWKMHHPGLNVKGKYSKIVQFVFHCQLCSNVIKKLK